MSQPGAWECPRCHVINAWFVRQCRCRPNGQPLTPTQTASGSVPLRPYRVGDQKWTTVSFDAKPGHFLAVDPPEGTVAAIAMTREGITAMQTVLETAAKILDGDPELARWRDA